MKIKNKIKKINWPKLIAAIAICFLAAAIGSVFTSSAIPGWYQTIKKPSFNPPSWIFGPVWTILYLLMGLSAYLVWKKESFFRKNKVNQSLLIFLVQLIFNALWSVVFFGLNDIVGAMAVIVALWFLILATIIQFYKMSKTAAYLLVPYFLWVTFASILNLAIVLIN